MIRKYFQEERLIYKMLFDGILIGLFSGGCSVFYRFVILRTDQWRAALVQHTDSTHRLIYGILLVAAAFIVTALLRWAPLSGGSGIPQIRGEVIGQFHMEALPTLCSKILGGALGNFAGFSLGREGPSIQIGGAVAKLLAKALGRDKDEMHFMVTAGASAGLSAAFNAPLSGTVFAMEEIHKSFSRYVWIPCIIASVIANFLSFTLMGHDLAFSFSVSGNLPLQFTALAAVVGIVTGVVGVCFNRGIVLSQRMYKAVRLPLVAKILLLMGVSFFVGQFAYPLTGGGHALLEHLAQTNPHMGMLFLLLVGKLLFTCLCFGSGVQGGIFLPVLVLGGLSGAVTYHFCAMFFAVEGYYVNFIILGMAGILTSVVRAPILSILLVTEMAATFDHLLGVTISAICAYYIAELLRNSPIYETLYENLRKRFSRGEEEEQDEDYAIYEYHLTTGSTVAGKKLSEIEFPRKVIVVAIKRGDANIIPSGDEPLLAGDRILILTHEVNFALLDEFFRKSYLDQKYRDKTTRNSPSN